MKRWSFLQTHFQRAIIANSPDLHLACTASILFDTENLITAFTNIVYFHLLAPSPVFIIFPGERVIYTFLFNCMHSWPLLFPALPMFPRRLSHAGRHFA